MRKLANNTRQALAWNPQGNWKEKRSITKQLEERPKMS
jgi:hypothetical protein